MIEVYMLLGLMIIGAVVALEAKDLLSAVISYGVVGFCLVLLFLILQAPDLAIVQIVVETLTLVIMIAAIMKTSREDTTEAMSGRKVALWLSGLAFLVVFMLLVRQALQFLPDFGDPVMRMAGYYVAEGLAKTGAANLVAAVILDFRAYDTLGEATVLFTAVMGVTAVLRKIGRKKPVGQVQ
jgi:multisubunit Na+/H+ antiporter MnhB subunit